MNMSSIFKTDFWPLLALVFLPVTSTNAATPSVDEMWEIIQQQQKTIEQLQTKLAATDDRISDTAENVEAAVDIIEQVTLQDEPSGERTTIGGYGELHYNNLTDDNKNIGGDDDVSRADFHRFVLYFGHEFTDNIRFFSELELEHALSGDGAPGEVELEQAWVEMDLNSSHRLRAGLDILPIGIINPIHEPNTFYGVERNRIESEIIPATWWEAGISLIGELGPGWNYDLVLHSGLGVPTSGSSALRPRSGRLKVAEADDQDLAITGRLRYTGIPGLELGISGQYQSDITGTDDAIDVDATLFEGHMIWRHESGIALQALYARWDYGSDPLLNPDSINADVLDGFYIEPSYRFSLPYRSLGDLGIFARYSTWDERNRISGMHRFENFDQITFGFNWWPHNNVAVKFDAQFEDADGPVDRVLDGINVGVGYQF